MKNIIVTIITFLSFGALAAAQNFTVALELLEKGTDVAVGYATVSLTPDGAKKPSAYALSNENGYVTLQNVRKGTYTLKAELLGYKAVEQKITVTGVTKLGTIRMETDNEQLEAASVSATGNPIIIKKDTIEYNASSFKITDNDVLEDLLKKLPGVDVGEDGGITVNGESVKKITIDGKTFFLDDPQLASKNIPAKIINKLKVVEKKSDQAEFTGIDDGERETVIDLSVKPGMMKGAFGNVMAGAGHDIPTDAQTPGDWRYQGAAFLGKFTDKQQLSLILNGNNTNNRGFNDLSGSMMQGMRGGGGGRGRGQGGWGGGNGITTSYMGGLNGAWDLCDGDMELGGNYLYNYTDKAVKEHSDKTVYQKDGNLIYKTSGRDGEADAINYTVSNGHRFGIRLDHEFSKNTSILFIPSVNFGSGGYSEESSDMTFKGSEKDTLNTAKTKNTGSNRNVSTNGFLLFRQRLGAPGRTLSLMGRYSFSNNDLAGLDSNSVNYFDETPDSTVYQEFKSNAKNTSLYGKLTYTEPLGGDFYVDANYGYSWTKNTSDKKTYNLNNGGALDPRLSNEVSNTGQNHEFGANFLYQNEKFRVQVGAAAMPNQTLNVTKNGTADKNYDSGWRWNWAPQAMVWAEPGKNFNFRLFYRGRTGQPSTSQLMPVPDNADPLNVSFGNPALTQYFTHMMRANFRYSDKKTFLSFNFRLNGDIVRNPVVNMMWYNNGAQYSMPFNSGKNTFSCGLNGFLNAPIAKSDFSISDNMNLSWSDRTSFVGNNIDMTTYQEDGFYAFMEEMQEKMDFKNKIYEEWRAAHVEENTTRTLSVFNRIRFIYRNDALELTLSERTRYNQSWYTVASENDRTATFNNQVRLEANWTWKAIGMTLKGNFNYNWYNGYSNSNPQPYEYVLDAEIQKNLFKNKFTIGLKAYDILGQSKNLTVTDNANYHTEAVNNTLGRYIILSLTYRFGNMDKSRMSGSGMGRPHMR